MRLRFVEKCISFAAVLAAFSACNTVEKDFTPAAEQIAAVEEYAYTFNLLREGEDPATKATIGESRVEWETSDKVGTFIGSFKGYSNVNLENEEATITIYSTSAISAGEKVYAYFPYRASQTSASEASIYIPSIQHGVSESAMPMVGIPYTMPEAAAADTGTSGAISFMNLGSIINFRVYSTNLAYVTEKVQYIRFTSDSGIVGTGTLDLTKVDDEDVSTLTVSDYDGKIATVYQEANVGASRSESGEISMVIAPGTYSGTIVVVTDQASYTYEITSPKEFKRAYRKNLGVNLAVGQRGEIPESAQYIPYSETFITDGKGLFTIENVSMGGFTGDVWTESTKYGMKASAYSSNTSYATESWLISPLINLDKAVSPVLTFDHTMNYGQTSQITLWIRKEGADWEQVTIPTYPTGSDWTYVSSGDISLSAYVGNIIQIGFKYTSTTSSAPTWEIKNFKVDGSYSSTPDVATPLVMGEISATSTTSSITFSWNTVANAVGYLVRFDGNTATQQTTTSYTATGLDANTTYQISVIAVGDGTYYSNSSEKVAAMTTEEDGGASNNYGWLELPAQNTVATYSQVAHYATMNGSEQRNYTILYDPSMYTSYWVAYPLCADHMGSGRTESWGYDPLIAQSQQTSVASGYGVSISTTNYSSNLYARGHQLPNADRNGVDAMMAQTYYSTNMTPQIQNGFNGGIWVNLETAVRGYVPSGDTLYVVTGAAFYKETAKTETVKYITNKNDSKSLPIPNYYYKVVLKVKRSGNTVSSASAIGFWLPHDDLKGKNYEDYTQSVDQIEQWTGFDFFANLPTTLQQSAEANTNLSTFKSF